jgi:hypothetical protein
MVALDARRSPDAASSDAPIPDAPDVDLDELGGHIGALIRVGGLVVDLEPNGFTLDDGTAIGRIELRGVALDALALIEPMTRSTPSAGSRRPPTDRSSSSTTRAAHPQRRPGRGVGFDRCRAQSRQLAPARPRMAPRTAVRRLAGPPAGSTGASPGWRRCWPFPPHRSLSPASAGAMRGGGWRPASPTVWRPLPGPGTRRRGALDTASPSRSAERGPSTLGSA